MIFDVAVHFGVIPMEQGIKKPSIPERTEGLRIGLTGLPQ
jgi:hypothetical protein